MHGRPDKLFSIPGETHYDQSFEADWDDLVDMTELVDDQINNEADLLEEYFKYLSTQLLIDCANDWETARLNFLRLVESARN